MHSVSGVDLVTAKLQSSLLQAQRKFIASNPGGARSKNHLRKEKKREKKLRRQFPQYKNLSNKSSPTDSSQGRIVVSDDFEDNIFGSTNNWNPAQIQIDFEEVDQSNIFIEQVKAKYECLNPSYTLERKSVNCLPNHKQKSRVELESVYNQKSSTKNQNSGNLLGTLPSSSIAKNEDVDSGVDSLGGSSSSSIPPSSSALDRSLEELEQIRAEKKKKKNLERKKKNKLQKLLLKRLNSLSTAEETEKLLPSKNSSVTPSSDKINKKGNMKDLSSETDVDTTPATATNHSQSSQTSLCSSPSKVITNTGPVMSPHENGINGNGSIHNGNDTSTTTSSSPSPKSPSAAKIASPGRPTRPATPVQNKNNINAVNGGKIPQLPQPKYNLYAREKIQPGWRQKMPVGCGFSNMGNSCYMNATLQALFHVPSFVNWLLSDETHRNKCKGYSGNQFTHHQCIVCAMYNTLKESLNQHQSQSIRPSYIHQRLKVICKHFTHGRQEDAHEFLRYLLESMERSYLTTLGALKVDVRSKETTPIGQIFGGYIRTEVTCLRCNTLSTTFQPLAELQLDIRHVTSLEDAITNHFKRERLDNNDYKCEKCRTFSAATKQFSLEVPPIVLCLQLKRFNPYGMKITKPIHCNRTLNLTRFLHKSLLQGNHKDVKYRLTSLITHIGSSPNCGHYTAIAQAANGNLYQFDDSYVRSVAPHQAVNSDAYVIIYELDTGNYEKPSTCYNTNYNNSNNSNSNGNLNSSLSTTPKSTNSNLSKLLTSSTGSESKNGLTSSSCPLTNGINKSENRPKFQNPFLKATATTEKSNTANSNPFAKLSQFTTTSNGTSTSTTANGLTNGSVASLDKREKVSFSLHPQNSLGVKVNSTGTNKIQFKIADAHIQPSSSYLTNSARARHTLSEKAVAALEATASKFCGVPNGTGESNSKPKSDSVENDSSSLLKTELQSPAKKPPLEVSATTTNLKTLPSLVPYDPDDDDDSSEEEKEQPKSNEQTASSMEQPPPPQAKSETLKNQSPESQSPEKEVKQQSPQPVKKYFPIFNKTPIVKSWDGQKSVISQVDELNRKREKAREQELEDEEFDAAHAKKRKVDEPKSRSSSGSRDSNDYSIGGFSNKFQVYEDRRRMVEKMSIPSSLSGSSSSFGNPNHSRSNSNDSGLSNGFNSSGSGNSQEDRRNQSERVERSSSFNDSRRDSNSSNSTNNFPKYTSPNYYNNRGNNGSSNSNGNGNYHNFGRGGSSQGNRRYDRYNNDSNSFRRGGRGNFHHNRRNNDHRYNNNSHNSGNYYNNRHGNRY